MIRQIYFGCSPPHHPLLVIIITVSTTLKNSHFRGLLQGSIGMRLPGRLGGPVGREWRAISKQNFIGREAPSSHENRSGVSSSEPPRNADNDTNQQQHKNSSSRSSNNNNGSIEEMGEDGLRRRGKRRRRRSTRQFCDEDRSGS